MHNGATRHASAQRSSVRLRNDALQRLRSPSEPALRAGSVAVQAVFGTPPTDRAWPEWCDACGISGSAPSLPDSLPVLHEHPWGAQLEETGAHVEEESFATSPERAAARSAFERACMLVLCAEEVEA